MNGSVEYGSPTSAKRTRIEEPHPFPQSQISITTFSAAQRQSLVESEPTSKFPSGENGDNPSQSTTAPVPVDELFRPSATRAFLNVFRHLSPSDLAASALVSRKWQAAILSARDQLAKFPIRLIFRYNERGAAYPGFTIAKYYDRRRFPIDIEALKDPEACGWLRHCTVESVRFGYDMNCYLDCYGDGLRDAFLDYLVRQRNWFLKDVTSVSFDRVKMQALSRQSLSRFLNACGNTLASLQFSAVSINETDLIDAGVLAVLPRLRHLVIHEPRPDHTIPKYPTDPYANIGDDIFAVAIRQIENGTAMRMRLNFCGQITVAGIIAMIEAFVNECLRAALPCRFDPVDNDVMHFVHRRQTTSQLRVVIDCKDETYEQPSFYISSGRGGNGSLDDASEDEAESYVSIDGGSTDDDATDSEESE